MQQNNNQNYNYNNYYNPDNPPYSNVNAPLQADWQRVLYYQAKRKRDIKELIITGIVIGSTIIGYLLMQSIAVMIMYSLNLYDLYQSSALFQNCFNIVGVHIFSLFVPFGVMALILKKRFEGPVIPVEKVGFVNSLAWITTGMGFCILANYATGFVIQLFKSFGYELTQSEILKPDSVITCVALLFSTAIVPAVFEEFAMRCCTLGVLRKNGKGFAVFAVSIVFGLLHGNIIQFVFAFIVGLILAYVTIRTNSVVPAMFIHGFNNGLSVTQNIIKYTSGEKMAENVITVIFILWIVFSIIGFIYLVKKGKFFPPKQEKKIKEPYALSFGTKLACLIPGFFIPFLALIYISSQTIVPV